MLLRKVSLILKNGVLSHSSYFSIINDYRQADNNYMSLLCHDKKMHDIHFVLIVDYGLQCY